MQMHSSTIPEDFAGYKLLSPGEPGPGAWSTYLAEDSVGARVYLRLLPSDQIPLEKQTEFDAQSKKLPNLSHSNLVKVLRAGKTETHFYLVSEWIGNDSLKKRLDPSSGEIGVVQMLLIVRQVIQALADALRRGISHGNLDASCILFDYQGRIKVDGIVGNSNTEDVLKDRQVLAWFVEHSASKNTRPEIYQRLAKLIKFIVNPELEKTPIGYQKILEQIAPIISLCDGLKRFYDVSLFCPYCRDPLATGKLVRCAVCFTAQHKSCWKEAKKCSVYNCTGNDIARIWSKRRIVSNSLLFAVITLAALLGWGFYFYERLYPSSSQKEITKKDVAKLKPANLTKRTSGPPRQLAPVPKVEKRPFPTQQKVETVPPPVTIPVAVPAASPPVPPRILPIQFTMDKPVILFPKSGDKLYVGATYEIKWVNSVPARYRNNPNILWTFAIFSPNKFVKNYHFPPETSSFFLTVTEDFVIADNYRLNIYLGSSCDDRRFECLSPNNNGYELENPFSVSVKGSPW